MSKNYGNLATPILLGLLLIILINFSGLRKAMQPQSKPESTNVEASSEASFETRVTAVNSTLMVITIAPKSNTKMTNQTHDLIADALNRLNIQANDIVATFPATDTEPPILLVLYNSILHSRATEYEVKE